MTELDPSLLWSAGGAGTLAGLAGLGVWLHKMLGVFARDSKVRAGDDATKGTIDGLRTENARLSTRNAELVEWFIKAQDTIMRMSSENQRMQLEIEQLRTNMAAVLSKHQGA